MFYSKEILYFVRFLWYFILSQLNMRKFANRRKLFVIIDLRILYSQSFQPVVPHSFKFPKGFKNAFILCKFHFQRNEKTDIIFLHLHISIVDIKMFFEHELDDL